jgi:PKD repeat protein
VSDAIGQDYVTTRTVTAVTELPPLTVSIAVTPQSATVGAGVTFTATAGGGVGPFSYRWVFADGRVFEGASVTAPFMTGGSHAATVTVTDAAGQTATASAVVQVTASRRRPVSRP